MINFRCDQCNQKLSASEVHAGQKVKCSQCKNIIIVPEIKKAQIHKTQSPAELQSGNRENIADFVKQEQDSNLKTNSTNISNRLRVSCSKCGSEYMISNRNLGRKFTCTECGNEFFANLSKPEVHEIPEHNMRNEITKDCPYCGEEVLERAIKCKHCGEFLNQSSNAIVSRSSTPLPQVPEGQSTHSPRIAAANSAYCPSCSNIVSNRAKICPSCGIELQTNEEGVSTGLLIAGWLGVAFFTPLGFVVGIICCCKGRTGSGILMILLSIISTFIGLILMGV